MRVQESDRDFDMERSSLGFYMELWDSTWTLIWPVKEREWEKKVGESDRRSNLHVPLISVQDRR
jgi:hypothetical protein